MKYIIILIAILAIGCTEKPTEPTQEEEEVVDCYCGQVEGWGGSWTIDGRQLTWEYKITNNCTNAPWFFNTNREITEDEYCRGFQW